MKQSSYFIYFAIYSIISYKTDFGFEYSDSFELLWGSILCAFLSGIVGNIIFKASYKLAGFMSTALSYDSDKRRTAHWKFRMFFSLIVLLFSFTPLCSALLTPVVHGSYELLTGYYNDLLNEIINILTPK